VNRLGRGGWRGPSLHKSWACICLLILLCPTVTLSRTDRHPTRQQLIGAWRLVAIDYVGPKGTRVDPFYQADSTGIIIYDASGWMSVQIAAPHRQGWEVPASRLTPAVGENESALKVAAFDSYYAYFGTWKLDEKTATMTHHVASSVVPAENGVDYSQQVSLENGRLVFTTHSGSGAEEITRTKRWERIVP
jgi:hypothetical protein